MIARRFDNPAGFYAHVAPMLLRHEAENCFFLGHIPTLTNPTDTLLLTVDGTDNSGDPVAVAVMTPGRVLVVTRASADAVVAIASHLHENQIPVPGVQGPPDVVDKFVREWSRLRGAVTHSPLGLGIHQLTRVIAPASPPGGAMRVAMPADLDLITRWIFEFSDEIHEPHVADGGKLAKQRIETGSLFVWEVAGQLVAMAGTSGRTPNGIRINLVYTPRPFRRRGYATALVTALSQHQLDAGRAFCFLYTDLSNPTSNKIYRTIGYEPVGENVRIEFQ